MALVDYGLPWDPANADRDVIEVETYYQATGGEFWVIDDHNRVVGSAAYYPVPHGFKAVEIRKMYLQFESRGQGLGQFLLTQLEHAIASQGYQTIWIETASVLKAAIHLYEKNGYQQPEVTVDYPLVSRCDCLYVKRFLC